MNPRNPIKNMDIRQKTRRIDSEEKLVNYIRTQLGEPMVTVDVSPEQILQCIDDSFIKFSDWALAGMEDMLFIIEVQKDIQDYILDDRVKSVIGASFADGVQGYGNSSGSSISLGDFGTIGVGYVPYVDGMGNVSSLTSFGTVAGGTSGVAGGIAGNTANTNNGIESIWASMVQRDIYQKLFSSHISFDYNESNHTLRLFGDVQGPVVIEAAIEYIPNPIYDLAYNHAWIKSYSKNLVKRLWGQQVGKYSQSLIGGATINYDRIISEAQEEIDKLDEDLMSKYSPALGIFSA